MFLSEFKFIQAIKKKDKISVSCSHQSVSYVFLKKRRKMQYICFGSWKRRRQQQMNGGLCDSSVCDAEISFIFYIMVRYLGQLHPPETHCMLILSWKLKWSYRSQRGRTWRHADTFFLHALLLKQRPPVVSSVHCRLQDFLLERAVCIYSACGII